MTINPVNRRDEQRRTPKRCEMKAIAQGLEEQYKGKMSYVLPTTKGKRQPWLSVFQLPPHKRRSPGRLIPLLEWGGSLSNNQQETKQHCLRGGKASGRKCRLLGRAGDYSPLLINTRATCSNREAPLLTPQTLLSQHAGHWRRAQLGKPLSTPGQHQQGPVRDPMA